MRKIALATSQLYAELSQDDKHVLNKLLYWGVDVEPIVWDSKDAAWNQFDAVFIRSCWDYHLRNDEFFKWIDSLAGQGIAVFNSPDTMRWNSSKTYLKDLQEKDIAVVPTVWINSSEDVDLQRIMADKEWESAVVKPVVSANAYETWVTQPEAAAQNQTRAEEMLNKHGGILVQQFIENITRRGEWSFIFFDGVYSHSVIKKPQQGEFRVQENLGATVSGKKPPRHLIHQAQQIIEKVGHDCLYARVDAVEGKSKLLLMELELIEPSLYLEYHPKAAERFAEAIIGRINSLHVSKEDKNQQ